jgi:CHAD domain
MGYRLRTDEEAANGVRRVARGQLDLAADQLAGKGEGDLDTAVHESRKAFKRLRALVRVARDALGDEAYRRENVAFRDAGRRLSATRDAAVMVETLDDLTERYRGELSDDAFSGLRDALASEAAAASDRLAEDTGAVEEVQGALEAARRRVAGWPLDDDGGLEMLEPGFERIYRRGRLALKAAQAGSARRLSADVGARQRAPVAVSTPTPHTSPCLPSGERRLRPLHTISTWEANP